MDFLARFPASPGRPSSEAYFLGIALLAATRGTCARRRVGCVLVSERKHILATGYNGVARGRTHCVDVPCPGAGLPSGSGLDKCEAIHAEQNALLQCRDIYAIDTVYCTASPCVHCVKLLLNTSAKRIVFIEPYPHSDSEKLWMSADRKWHQFGIDV